LINWTFSRFTDFPPLKTAHLLERFFSTAEITEYQKFKIPKRQSEWLASRLLVKQLVQRVFDQKELPLESITLRKEPSGVPYVALEGQQRVGWLSISHSQGGVLAAFSQEVALRFGVDLEFIEPRPLDLFADYFTPSELAWISSLDEQCQKVNANLVWSAKEAYLKALEKGLQMDTRKINIYPSADVLSIKGWNTINFDVGGKKVHEWQLLFSLRQDYVMTICLPETLGSFLEEVNNLPSLEG
jgi:phosphopantetheinyl transferase